MVCRNESPGGLDAAGLDNDHVNTELFNLHAQRIAERLEGVLGGVVPAAQRCGQLPPMEEMLMMVPEPWVRMCGVMSWVRRARPKRFTSNWRRASSMGTSSMAP